MSETHALERRPRLPRPVSGQPVPEPQPLVEPAGTGGTARSDTRSTAAPNLRPVRRRFLAPVAKGARPNQREDVRAAASPPPVRSVPADAESKPAPPPSPGSAPAPLAVEAAHPEPPAAEREPARLRLGLSRTAIAIAAAAVLVVIGVIAAAVAIHRPPPSCDGAAPTGAQLSSRLTRAQAGDACAQLDVAILYAKGDGTPQDYPTAAKWFQAAAEQGVPRAQYDLGVLYERGRGVAADAERAFQWYRKAAESGYALAQYNLAIAYTRGEGTPPDFTAASDWYRRAAVQGVIPAMVNLAILYERGEGVEKSVEDAYAWYRAAARRGNVAAARRAEELLRAFSPFEQSRAEAKLNEVLASIHDTPPTPGTAPGQPAAPPGTVGSQTPGQKPPGSS